MRQNIGYEGGESAPGFAWDCPASPLVSTPSLVHVPGTRPTGQLEPGPQQMDLDVARWEAEDAAVAHLVEADETLHHVFPEVLRSMIERATEQQYRL